MPMDDFNQIADHLNDFYREHLGEAICVKDLGKCQMKNDCQRYRDVQLPGGFLNITMQDEQENKLRIHLHKDNMFLNSSQIGIQLGSGFKC